MGYIRPEELRPGMRLKNDLISASGRMFLAEDTILTEVLINRILGLGIRYINIKDESGERKPEPEAKTRYQMKEEKFIQAYRDSSGSVRAILDGVRNGREIMLDEVREAVNTFIDLVIEDDNLIPKLYKMQDVDEYTYDHSINVSLLCIMIGKWLKYNDMELKKLAYSGVFHDIGKSKVPLEIINKPGPLDEKEWRIMRQHPVYGYNILKDMKGISRDVLSAVLMHHEREDGRGYPFGIEGVRIHPYAKVVAVADVFDAMASDRVYRKREPAFEVVEHIERSGFVSLDPRITRVFLKGISQYFVGRTVRLSDGRIGDVIYLYPNQLTKVVVKVGEEFVDFCSDADTTVDEILD